MATGVVYCSVVASIVAGAVVVVNVTAYYCCGYMVVAGEVSTAVLLYGSAAAADGSAGGICGVATVGCCATNCYCSYFGCIYGYSAAGPASNETLNSKSLHKFTTSNHWMALPPAAHLCSHTLSSSATDTHRACAQMHDKLS